MADIVFGVTCYVLGATAGVAIGIACEYRWQVSAWIRGKERPIT